MADIGYTLDITGRNPLNKVTETRTLTKKVVDGRAIVIPKASPFFAESAVVYRNGLPLVKGHDYQLILDSTELTHTVEHDIRGGFIFNTVGLNEEITFEVQTVGGDFNLPIGNTVENSVRLIRNPIFTTWEQIIGTPAGLPTFTHIHDFSATVGYEQYIASIDRLADAVRGSGGSGGGSGDPAALLAHINSPSAHTKAQVGLNLVQNYSLAQDADFNNKPYANDKYVTPRTVMFAINLYIGSVLTEQDALIKTLSDTVAENTTAYNSLVTSWEDLKSTLSAVSNNYDRMVLTVAQYSNAVIRYEGELKAINDNQKEWLAKIQEFNQVVTEYSDQYEEVIATKQELLTKMGTLEAAYDANVKALEDLKKDHDKVALLVTAIEEHTMFPEVKIIPAGSFHFRVKAGEKYAVTLIGAGGGVGEFITDDITIVPYCRGENGGSTSLWCLQNTITGEQSPASQPIAIAGGGWGGEASFGTPTNVTKYGLGGRGGNFKIQEGITIEEASAGEGGIKGYGNYVAGDISKQDMGYELYGSKWGKGATRENALGQAGEGAITRIVLHNTFNKDLEYMVKVGEAGRSHHPDKGSSTGGLAVLTKIKK